MSQYVLLLPEGLLVIAALQSLFHGKSAKGSRCCAGVNALFVIAALVVAVMHMLAGFAGTLPESPVGHLMRFDALAMGSRVLVLVMTLVWLIWSMGKTEARAKEALALALLSSVGSLVLCSANELITMMISLELSALPLYIMLGYARLHEKSLEGALKYFLLSMLTSMIMLYGLSFVYGMTGTTAYEGINLTGNGLSLAAALAVVLTFTGLMAKLSAAPFHFWAPDAFEGASSWSLAFVASVPKLSGVVALLRFIHAVTPAYDATISLVVALIAAASMILGNLVALRQSNLKRMMAYSSIAHAGYLLVAMAALGEAFTKAAVLYLVVYAFATMGIMLIAQEVGPTLKDFSGLAHMRPVYSWSMVVLLCSLIGIPPLAGFFGKLSLFTAALGATEANLLWLVVIALLMSVVSCGYYLRVVYSMFFSPEPSKLAKTYAPVLEDNERAGIPYADDAPTCGVLKNAKYSFFSALAVALCVVATVGLGLGAQLLYALLGL